MNALKPTLPFNNRIRNQIKLIAPVLILAALSLACRWLEPARQPSPLPLELSGKDDSALVGLSAMVEATLVALTPAPSIHVEGNNPTPLSPALTAVVPIVLETPAPDQVTPTAVLQPSSTPDSYALLTIESLIDRAYGGGGLEVREIMEDNATFTRYLVSYPSDGISIYGFMNVPKGGAAPFPVVIALHGYIDPAVYKTLDYTTVYADALAQAGYLVLHPNLRGYAPSGNGDNQFRVGMAIDVLNLIALIKQQGGSPGPLEQARPEAIGLWGHSMGGGISIRVITVSPDIRAAVLYGAMSGDEQQNFGAIYRWSNGQRGLDELAVPEDELLRISPVYYYDRIRSAVSIHHGENDQMAPLQWSLDLCKRLQELGKPNECFTYPGQPHTFDQTGSQVFMQRTIEFFDRELRLP